MGEVHVTRYGVGTPARPCSMAASVHSSGCTCSSAERLRPPGVRQGVGPTSHVRPPSRLRACIATKGRLRSRAWKPPAGSW